MVNKQSLLIKSNLKKSFKQIVALILLVILSSLIFNILLTISMDYSKNFDIQKNKLNCGDYLISVLNVTNVDSENEIKEVLDNEKDVHNYQIVDVVGGYGTIDFGKDSEITNYMFFESYSSATSREYDRYEIVEESNEKYDWGVYLSYLFKSSAKYNLGDTLNIELNGVSYAVKVQGFYNNATTGTINCGSIGIIIDDAKFNEITSPGKNSYLILLDTGGKQVRMFTSRIGDEIVKKCPHLILCYVASADGIGSNRNTTAKIFETILILASIIMISVLLVIIAIILSNYIKNNVVNFGILKSIGYDSKSLIWPLILEFGVLIIVSSIVGVGLSYAFLPLVNNALESQIGLPYKITFLLIPCLIVVGTLLILSTIVSYLSIRKIRKIYPINAIREDKNKKTGMRKEISLAKSKLPLNVSLGLNTCIKGIARNIIISLTFITISFMLGFSCFTYQNVIKDRDNAISLVCGQTADSALSVYKINEDNLKTTLDNKEEVLDYYLFSTYSIILKDSGFVKSYVIDSNNSYLDTKHICVDGRMPNNEFEITINKKIAKNKNIDIGDNMTFSSSDGDVEFKVVGFSQGAYYEGNDCYITREGYEKISSPTYLTYFVDLKEGTDVASFNDEISRDCSLFYTINEEKYLNSVASTYFFILMILCITIAVLSVAVTAFVLYVLFTILLENKRREHGILKSLGFTSKDIILQMELSVVLTSVVSIFIGLLLSKNGASKLFVLMLKNIGIFKFGTSTSSLLLLIAGLSLVLFVILLIAVLSRSIKKISPHQLFNREWFKKGSYSSFLFSFCSCSFFSFSLRSSSIASRSSLFGWNQW